MIQLILNENIHRITSLKQPWLNADSLNEYAQSLEERGCPYKECFGFLDGTIRPVSRPTRNQKAFYNGHKRVHSIKFQSMHLPNGLIGNLHGPVHGRRHDSYLLQSSRLICKMRGRFFTRAGIPYHLYGDPAYPLNRHLITPFPAHFLTPDRAKCNKIMSSIRISVEWGFGKLVRYFAFLDFKKNLKIGMQPVHQYYQVGAILINCNSCLYGSQTSRYFDCEPPTLEEYLS